MAKLDIHARCVVAPDGIMANKAHAEGLGLPYAAEKERPPLVVLGGGRSSLSELEWARDFPGDRWIIGSAFKWWKAQGIDGTFFSVHPSPKAVANVDGVERALLATVTDPSVFAALQGVPVEIFGLEACGATSATATPFLALRMGYTQVTYIGCESSYNGGTHAYADADDPYLMKVEVGGDEYLTGAEFIMQAEFLATVIRGAPHVFGERSGGLLRALVESDGEYDVKAISRLLAGLEAA